MQKYFYNNDVLLANSIVLKLFLFMVGFFSISTLSYAGGFTFRFHNKTSNYCFYNFGSTVADSNVTNGNVICDSSECPMNSDTGNRYLDLTKSNMPASHPKLILKPGGALSLTFPSDTYSFVMVIAIGQYIGGKCITSHENQLYQYRPSMTILAHFPASSRNTLYVLGTKYYHDSERNDDGNSFPIAWNHSEQRNEWK
ncbi:hypothetical protein [Cysteiniphilum sp. 6C5]